MQFTARKRRQPPTVIIISLIDILIVLLIFLMVTTTFKQRPAVTIALPESKQASAGATEDHLVITIAKEAPYLYLNSRAVTVAQLEEQLSAEAARRPGIGVLIESDKGATVESFVQATDATRAAKISRVSFATKTTGSGAP